MQNNLKEKSQKEACEEICDVTMVHKDIIENVSSKMIDEDSLSALSDFFKTLGDPTRMRILWALSEAEMCVCDIAYLLNMSQSAISHQLRVLKQNRFVKNKKVGKVVYYSLLDRHIKDISKQAFAHINE
ncbi:transcriptional regulator, ArsR family [Campylobacter blaseri]|uniref:Transcriptional regulator n=1 Tax=Campylobacter blaseri TaxID=2042961 RepID=A0A2P8QZ13_9BACT|nr:metalloregulator ArsR/SmtB family transcription factor [Campylobacter blaseri]PSM51483.1 transcriptional regulator [Campylobacter blaseri]PSM52932.1 transcriptional regulator [Campylobacter blaseri]QKF86509.1 transcriptional regulator, ArsR family [Campylobacter blaseri]